MRKKATEQRHIFLELFQILDHLSGQTQQALLAKGSQTSSLSACADAGAYLRRTADLRNFYFFSRHQPTPPTQIFRVRLYLARLL
jgi:hypothetical protein